MWRSTVNGLSLAALLLTLSHSIQAQIANFRWATPFGGGAEDTAMACATDPDGNSYVTGHFYGVANFDGIVLQGRGDLDAFVAKFGSNGRIIWATRAGSTNTDEGRGIAFDQTGNVFVTGVFRNEADFGPTNLTSAGRDDAFLAKYSPAGQLIWVRQMGGTNFDASRGVAVDSTGNCYTTGSFQGAASFGGTNLTAFGNSDIFVAKHSSAGELLWVRQAGGTNLDEGRAVAVSSSGDYFVTGGFGGSANFGSTNLQTADPGDVFVGHYRADGQLVWLAQAGGTNQFAGDAGSGVGLDAEGSCFVTGTVFPSLTASFGSTNLPGTSLGSTIFLAKYSRDGTLLWVRPVYGETGGQSSALAVSARGPVAMAGWFVRSGTFGTNILRSRTGQADMFVANYSTRGELLWAINAGGPAYNAAHGVGIDREERYYAAGWYRGNHSFGDIQVTNHVTGRDMFLTRIDGPPVLRVVSIPGGVTLSWPADASNFVLQKSLLSPPNWMPVTNPPVVTGGRRVVTNDTTDASRVYRLIRQ